MKQETIDGNRLIAEFMGFSRTVTLRKGVYKVPEGQELLYKAWHLHIDNMPYHTSWDWLMPVVERINTIAIDNYGETNVMIQSNQCRIGETWDDSVVITTKANHPVLIEMVYMAIVTFIKWYEAQKLFIL